MPETIDTEKKEKLVYLDSARGIAALMVLFGHFINWRHPEKISSQVTSLFINANDAVCFFFVLSGFVLSYKYLVLGHTLDIRKFYVNRLFRLWPAYFLTIVINALYSIRKQFDVNNLLDLFVYNNKGFWEEAILIRGRTQFYGPGWTLVIELIMSFFMPFAILIARKGIKPAYWLLIAVLLMGVSYVFQVQFVLGVIISCLFNYINTGSFKETKWYKYRYILLFVSFIFYSLRQIDRMSPLGPTYKYVAAYLGLDFFIYSGFAAFVFIIAIIQSKKVKQLLEHSIMRYIGKISYGIYLMHWLIVLALFDNWDYFLGLFGSTELTFTILLIGCLACTLISATIVHYAIELPFIRMGKRITQKMKPSTLF